MKKMAIDMIVVMGWILFWPHAILYFFSARKKDIYEDAMRNMSFRSASITGTSAVLYVLLLDRYYRSLFYYRIGFPAFSVSWLWRGDSSFSITAKNIMGGGILCAPIFNLSQCTLYRS